MNKIFLSAEWKYLIMANYEVDAAILKSYLPSKTELDIFNGVHCISLVGFLFHETRLLGTRIPLHINFEEVNLRFYVRRKVNDGWRRGVVFINEIVPKPVIALAANALYHEHYRFMPMRHMITNQSELKIKYEWKFKRHWQSLEVFASKIATPMKDSSEEEFITQHFWGYNSVSKSRTTEYQVEHPRWNIYPVTSSNIQCDFEKLYGKEFSFLGQAKPRSVFLAQGSEVFVHKGKLI